MNEETFLAVLRDNSADEVAWHALSDWLEENGQVDRAELLRLTRQLRAMPIRGRAPTEARVAELLGAGVRPVVVEACNPFGMRFALVPPGRFLMGSPEDEPKRKPNEHQHEVEITRPFWLGVFQVTQAQFTALMGANPSWFCHGGAGSSAIEGLATDDYPVENVLYDEALAFLEKLNAAAPPPDGWEYRLPTEAQWEYACRGGGLSREPFLFAAPSPSLRSSQANFDGNYRYNVAAKPRKKDPYLRHPCTVGGYEANPMGIHDLHGNVWEWCSDWFDEAYYERGPARDPPGPPDGTVHLIRGGSWDSLGESCRAANRRYESLEYRNSVLGFRAALAPRLG
jgi:uncharacterized protein (TIGR02996 family)